MKRFITITLVIMLVLLNLSFVSCGEKEEICISCKGTGKARCNLCIGSQVLEMELDDNCKYCGGTLYTSNPCRTCKGKGTVPTK